MERIAFNERPDWENRADAEGFTIHHMYGEPYWDETHAYKFTLKELEDNIEDPTTELIRLCYEAVDHVVNNPKLLDKLKIPKAYHSAICASWNRQEQDIYGRFDFAYDGKNPVKMLEFNADTPTSLYESAVFQWNWMEDKRKSGEISVKADQFNSIHEKLIEAFKSIKQRSYKGDGTFHFAGVLDSEEDKLTVAYIMDCAYQAGFSVHMLNMEDIGIDTSKYLTDLDDNRIRNIFKLYPWEHIQRETMNFIDLETKVFEPLWKSILSNKGILPILWKLFPDHPNLLAAYFAEDDSTKPVGYVKKPLFSREGQNVQIVTPDVNLTTEGEYGEEGFIVQEFTQLPKFGDDYALIGSWVVMGEAAGICIREDKSLVTQNLSRFVPHYIEG